MSNYVDEIAMSLVVPVRNEADSLPDFCLKLQEAARALGEPAEIIFVNDGSTDDTDAVLRHQQVACDCLRVVELSRPFGAASAITAGVAVAAGQAVITFDRRCGNWQELLGKLMANWRDGFEIVHAISSRATAPAGGKLATFGRSPAKRSVADMRLIDHKAALALRTPVYGGSTVDERVAELGFRQTTIEHDGPAGVAADAAQLAEAGKRASGATLLRNLLIVGSLLLAGGVAFALALAVFAICGLAVGGWAWLVMTVMSLSGVQLVSLSLVGHYVAVGLAPADHHPLYVVREMSGFDVAEALQPTEQSAPTGYVVYT